MQSSANTNGSMRVALDAGKAESSLPADRVSIVSPVSRWSGTGTGESEHARLRANSESPQ